MLLRVSRIRDRVENTEDIWRIRDRVELLRESRIRDRVENTEDIWRIRDRVELLRVSRIRDRVENTEDIWRIRDRVELLSVSRIRDRVVNTGDIWRIRDTKDGTVEVSRTFSGARALHKSHTVLTISSGELEPELSKCTTIQSNNLWSDTRG